jgi:16S rRNA (guanine966-N2)-methyltransferase
VHQVERTARATVRSVRVVAGAARGLRLVAPAGDDVRPTSDRVREALFNALGSLEAIERAWVLDLFAGSGALAIEALSRGADAAVLVDEHRPSIDAIAQNLAATDLTLRATVHRDDALAYLRRGTEGPFDLVVLDPPYRFTAWEELLAALVPWVTTSSLVVIESDREVALPPGWRVERRKRYGSTFVAIVRPPETRPSSQPEQR